MTNFVIIYRFSDMNARKAFREMIEDQFDKVKIEKTEEFTYYCVLARQMPEVEDALNTFIEHLAVDYTLDTGDYVAVYYSREEDPDNIKRVMVFGTDEYIENDIKQNYTTTHENTLIDLLNTDLLKQKA